MVFKDGEIYEGDYKDDRQHGHGTYTGHNYRYVGNWVDNKPDGDGYEEYSTFYIYQG